MSSKTSSVFSGFLVVIEGKSEKLFSDSKDAINFVIKEKSKPVTLYHPEGYVILSKNQEAAKKN
jgi:hypothetical protein